MLLNTAATTKTDLNGKQQDTREISNIEEIPKLFKVVFYNEFSFDILDENNYSFDYKADIDFKQKEIILHSKQFEDIGKIMLLNPTPSLTVPYEKIVVITEEELFKANSEKKIRNFYTTGKELNSDEEFKEKQKEDRKKFVESITKKERNKIKENEQGIYDKEFLGKFLNELIMGEDPFEILLDLIPLPTSQEEYNERFGHQKEFNSNLDKTIDKTIDKTNKQTNCNTTTHNNKQNTSSNKEDNNNDIDDNNTADEKNLFINIKEEELFDLIEQYYKDNVFSNKTITKIKELDFNKEYDINMLKNYLGSIVNILKVKEEKNIKINFKKLTKKTTIISYLKVIQDIFNNNILTATPTENKSQKRNSTKTNCNSKNTKNIIFVDASQKIDKNKCVIGLHYKNKDIKFATEFKLNEYCLDNSTSCEDLGVFLAINYAQINKLDRVVILIDNKATALKYGKMYEKNNTITISWIPREINEIADGLTKKEIENNFDFNFDEVFGSEIMFRNYFLEFSKNLVKY